MQEAIGTLRVKSLSLGEVVVTLGADSEWRMSTSLSSPLTGIELLEFKLQSASPSLPPRIKIEFSISQSSICSRWTPNGRAELPMWHETSEFKINSWLPAVSLFDVKGENRLTFAISEAVRTVLIASGAHVEKGDCIIRSTIEIPPEPGDLTSLVNFSMRIDSREIPFYEAIQSTATWFEEYHNFLPATVPESAYAPFYSTWYSYWSEVSDIELEEECALAKEYGMQGILVDDGWHTDKNKNTYAVAGDWEPSIHKFPDMAQHVSRVHALGMKYLPWIGTPIAGEESRIAKRFSGKFLYSRSDFSILDPRFPDVRAYLVKQLEAFLHDCDLDGFKLDYIEWFSLDGRDDPAVVDGYSDRDFHSIPLAVDALLESLSKRLRAIKPDVLIEFRQAYIGPSARKYANILRVGDCPANIKANRCGIANLRLTSGHTAVHSDMITWSLRDTPESAALQLLNVLFGVPQISMRLSDLPDGHRRMLRFWLGFMKSHRRTLLQSKFGAPHPEMCYPLLFSESETEQITAVYLSEILVQIEGENGKIYYIVNATGKNCIPLQLRKTPRQAEYFDVYGERLASPTVGLGLSQLEIPLSGMLRIQF